MKVVKSLLNVDFIYQCMMNVFFLVDAKPQCETDFDCSFDKTCSQGNCVFACSLVDCGLNAVCVPKNHRGVCECNPGYFGNPTIACNKGSIWIDNFIFLAPPFIS